MNFVEVLQDIANAVVQEQAGILLVILIVMCSVWIANRIGRD